MTNLPNSEQSGDLDNINVTRAQFRAEIGVFLEYVAQALGGVTGNYTTQSINPVAPILQGAPTLEPGATPPDDSRNDRIPSTRWVQEHGRYVGTTAPGTPADGMLWVDTAASPYALKAYNLGDTQWDLLSGVPSGTRMLFQQAAAPSGWTKVETGIDNHALRVTTGTPTIVSDQQAFSTVFSSVGVAGTVGSHTLTISEMPGHSHGITDSGHSHPTTDSGHSHSFNRSMIQDGGAIKCGGQPLPGGGIHEMGSTFSGTSGSFSGVGVSSASAGVTVQSNGADNGHSHGFTGTNLDLSINYVDVIVAQKD